MKKISILVLWVAILSACTSKQADKTATATADTSSVTAIFPKGNAIEGVNFNGTAYLQRLMTDSKTFDVVVSDVIFEPSARNSWHSHPGGLFDQVLLVIHAFLLG